MSAPPPPPAAHDAPSDQPPSDQPPSDQPPSDDASSDRPLSDGAPSDGAASDGAPSDGAPSDDAASDDAASDDSLSDGKLRRLAPKLCENAAALAQLQQLRQLHRRYEALFDAYMDDKLRAEERFVAQLQPLLRERAAAMQRAAPPDFWAVAFDHCDTLADNVTARDAAALRYLHDVSCEVATRQRPLPDASWPPGSFQLRFAFRPNPFFHNAALTKTYVMCEHDFEHAARALGCAIRWKAGKDLTVKTVRKKAHNGRTLVKRHPADSFFNFFDPPQPPRAHDHSPRADQIEDVLDADFELAECLKNDLIPRALLYYLDVADDADDDECERAAAERQRAPAPRAPPPSPPPPHAA